MIRKQQQRLCVRNEQGSRDGTLDCSIDARDRGGYRTAISQFLADERQHHFGIDQALAMQVRVGLPERRVIDDDAVMHADEIVPDDRLIVLVVELCPVGHEARVSHYGKRRALAGTGTRSQRRVQTLLDDRRIQ